MKTECGVGATVVELYRPYPRPQQEQQLEVFIKPLSLDATRPTKHYNSTLFYHITITKALFHNGSTETSMNTTHNKQDAIVMVVTARIAAAAVIDRSIVFTR